MTMPILSIFTSIPILLIVGGGVAGLWSAYQLALQGKHVILADENMVLGDTLMGSKDEIDGMVLHEWGSYIIRQLKSMSNVTLLASSTVFGFYDGKIAGVLEHIGHHSINIATKNESNRVLPSPYGIPYQRRWKIYFTEVILATGAIERPILFGNNDLPGCDAGRRGQTLCQRICGFALRRKSGAIYQ